ncbi:BQ2448_6848 [Microbotryum intermedium]|uniref:BQ2448_6848 protein n=1 Tax=Microbotryum intermedium TaxID=269621 RepID=A0A238FLM3_9BASI|nr:BQ2448_6848 [Microbotryum intermedium]
MTMPTKEPKIKEHHPRMRKTLWIKMMSTTKIPNVSFVAANVQSINEDRKRASLFSNLRAHKADIFLLSETGRPPPERVAQWTQECQDSKLSALFTPFNNTAILWKSDSPVVTINPESPSNFLRAVRRRSAYASRRPRANLSGLKLYSRAAPWAPLDLSPFSSLSSPANYTV